MVAALIVLLIWLVVVVVVAGLLLWAVGRFFPELSTPARYVVGAIAVIVILLALLKLVQGGALALP